MSTFGGKFEELPGISVDRFDHNNLYSEAYFLSHCHTDHMIGLNTVEFQKKLSERNCFLYVSHVSKAILRKLHPAIENQVKELDFHQPTPIYLKSGVMSVTPIPSGHCPGSVMFLFELTEVILYTGDFRMISRDVEKIKAFYDSYGNLKNIHSVYLDTTFFFKSYLNFPTREASLDEVCGLINKYIAENKEFIINIETPARYGYEYAFIEIFKRINMPVHVSKEAYAFYSLIPDMDQSITLDGSKTKIHNSCGTTFRNICASNSLDSHNIRTIKLSAMKWTNKDLEEGLSSENQNGSHFVCYSTHASYEECAHLIKFLKPKEVIPCVLRFTNEHDDQIFGNIEELLKSDASPKPKKARLFDLDKIDSNQKEEIELENDEHNFNQFFDSALESPPRSPPGYMK